VIPIEYFIAGILFVQIVIPILDGIAALFLALVELIKGRINIDIVKSNVKIQKLKDSLDDDGPKRAIGFAIPEETEEEDEDD
jgi:hypothetical protein